MVAVKLPAFGGMVPAVDDRMLPDIAAAYSENGWLYSGALQGMREPTLLRALDTATNAKVYRIPVNYTDAQHLEASTWLEFEHQDTDIIRAPVIDDTFDRYYFASPAGEPTYNTLTRIENSDAAWILGIPAPSVAPSINVVGGAATAVARSYVYTWVSEYGEEGPPSPPTTVTDNPDGSWDITLTAADADDIGGPDRNLTDVRIYRTVTSSSGVATYFLVVEQDINDTTYSDTSSDTTVASNSQLESTNWSAPPSDLKGFVSMPNGMIAGFRENEIWFCEPFRPHAWPALYTLAVEYPIIGLGVVNQALVVCTNGNPYVAYGVHPSNVSLSKLGSFEPCMSRGSIISAPEGVYYASPNGLILAAQGAVVNITEKLLTKDKWQSLVPGLSTLRAGRFGSAYYAFGSSRDGVFETTAFETTAFAQEDFTGAFDGVLIDPRDQRVAFNLLSHDDDPLVNIQNDPWSGELFIIRGGNLYWIDQSSAEPTYEPVLWRSKIYQMPARKNLGVMRVYFEVPDGTPTQNPVRNTSSVQTLASDQYGIIRVYYDGVLRCTREMRTSGELLRLPSGFQADFIQFEFETRVRVIRFEAAGTAKELAAV